MSRVRKVFMASIVACLFACMVIGGCAFGVSSSSKASSEGASKDAASESVANESSSNDKSDASLLGAAAGALGTNYSAYEVYGRAGHEVDENGFVILTQEAAGKRLEHGVSYRVKESVTLCPGGYLAGLVADDNLIYIDEGVTLKVVGANGSRRDPGLPGIALTKDKSLCVGGLGALDCRGGDAGSGSRGCNGGDGRCDTGSMYADGGIGGSGGAGGGGAGAGIGTAGGMGGDDGSVVPGPHVNMDKNSQQDGFQGSPGNKGAVADEPGVLCLTGSVAVALKGGNPSKGGEAGAAGKSSGKCYKFGWLRKYYAGGGGGGGGGASGCAGNSFGQGGTGGGGGGGGGTGGVEWFNLTRSNDSGPMGGGGGEGRGFYLPSESRGQKGSGTKTKPVDYCGGEGTVGAISPLQRDSYGEGNIKVYDFARVHGAQIKWYGTVDIDVACTSCKTHDTFPDAGGKDTWCLSNQVFTSDSGTAVAYVPTVALETTAKEVENALAKLVPQNGDKTFVGWTVVYNGNEYLAYDAATGKLCTDTLKDLHLLALEKSGDPEAKSEGLKVLYWSGTTAVRFKAKFEAPKEHFSVCYHAYQSTFVDKTTGAAAGVSEYTETCEIGGQNYTWDNKDIGAYHVVIPDALKGKDVELRWSLVDPAKATVRSTLGLGVAIGDKAPNTTFHLYAYWAKVRNGEVVEEE